MVLKKKGKKAAGKTLTTVAGKEAGKGEAGTEGGSDEPPGDGKGDTSNTEDDEGDNYQKEVITLLRGMNEGIKKNLEASEGIIKLLAKTDAPAAPAEEEEDEEEEDVEKTISESAAYKKLEADLKTIRADQQKLLEGFATLAALVGAKQDKAA